MHEVACTGGCGVRYHRAGTAAATACQRNGNRPLPTRIPTVARSAASLAAETIDGAAAEDRADIVYAFAQSSDVETRRVAAASPFVDPRTSALLVFDDDVEVRRLHAANEHIQPTAVRAHDDDDSSVVREAAAANPRRRW